MNTPVIVAVTACFGILAVVLALANARRRPPGGVPAATELVSDFEVSRVIGVSVAARGACGLADYHPLRGGDRLLQVRVLAGRAGRAAIRTHRRLGRPLPNAGDVAFSGDGWVLGRRGDVVVLLHQHDPGHWRVIGGLPWLLSTALDRVPVPEAGLYR